MIGVKKIRKLLISLCENCQSVGPMDFQYVEVVNHRFSDVCCHHSVVLTHERQPVASVALLGFYAPGASNHNNRP
jgi:hypothetical protein